MGVQKGPPPASVGGATLLFGSAEEAWFWYVRCQKARADGARFMKSANQIIRPCDPDDVYRVVIGLARRRSLTRGHLKVLNTYGNFERPPDPRCREEALPFRLWDEALGRMELILRAKEIIE